eukprot:s3537_g2.t1
MSFPAAVDAHWVDGYVAAAAHSCTVFAACLPLAVLFCMHNPNRRHRGPPHRVRGEADRAIERLLEGVPPPPPPAPHHEIVYPHGFHGRGLPVDAIKLISPPPPPAPHHEIVYPHGFHGRGLPVDAIKLISEFLPALRIRRVRGEDDIITPRIPPLYFLLSERMVVRILAGLKGEGLVRRRLWRKQPAPNMVVPRSAMDTAPPEPDMPPSTPMLSELIPEDALGDRFWDIDFLILPLLHHSLALFADFWMLGGSSLRGTSDFPEGLELATYPYTLRALPVDGMEWLNRQQGKLEQDNVAAMLQYSKGLELEPSAILDHVENGIQAAIDAGVFTCPGTSLQQQVPAWKKKSYQRVLHRFGLTNRFAHWHCYTSDRDDLTWGPANRPVQPQGNMLNANIPLPEDIPIIRAEGNAATIRSLGKTHCSSIDWVALATAAGDPAAADLLKDACYYTMWRRALGRHAGGHCPFTATGATNAGGALPPLGTDLATATLNLVAGGRQHNVNRHPEE